ncbi:MAG: glycosyltransferase family 4 protein [Fusobacteriota bacterium]
MKIVLVAPLSIKVPPVKYGGTQRDVYWLAKALSEKGHEVTVLGKKGSYVNERVKIIEVPEDIKEKEFEKFIPEDFDIVNYHVKINYEPNFPYLHSMHGNAKEKEFLPENTSFISEKHAENHGGKYYAYNGLELDDYNFNENPKGYFSFIGKISYKHKNVNLAIEVAKKSNIKLKIAGGRRVSFNKNIEYLGFIGGKIKDDFLKNSKGLIFPTAWEEPMGLVVIESLACGTPVIVSDRGAMPELVSREVGFVCKNKKDYLNAIKNIDKIDRKACRKRVEEKYSNIVMADEYLKLYKKILRSSNNKLHSEGFTLNNTVNKGTWKKKGQDHLLIEKLKEMYKKILINKKDQKG